MNERIAIPVRNGSFEAYLARPKAAQAPVVIVIQEIFGINADMRQTCDMLASHGYMALCPDLFWRLEPGIDMSDNTPAEWKRGFELYTAFDFDAGIEDVAATMAAAKTLAGSSGQVGVMGFCLGGLMAFRTAARHDVGAAVSYYGGGTENHLAEGDKIKGPMMMHLAEDDEYISKEAQQRIKEALALKKNIEIFSYPSVQHAFARNRGAHYEQRSAELAHTRTLSFLGRHLG